MSQQTERCFYCGPNRRDVDVHEEWFQLLGYYMIGLIALALIIAIH